MDPELIALASAAATTVVQLLTTDGWVKAKQSLGKLWRHVRPDRAERIEAALEDSREDLLAARDRGDAAREASQEELATQWEAQLRGLLAAEPQAADLLRQLMAQELEPALAAFGNISTTTKTTIKAEAKDHSQAIAAGGNVTIHRT